MKTRKVIVTMELETDMSIKALTNKESWACYADRGSLQQINQIQVNVVKEKGLDDI